MIKSGQVTNEELIAGADRYTADPNRDPSYTKHGATWLNAGCHNDGPLPPRGGQNGGRPAPKDDPRSIRGRLTASSTASMEAMKLAMYHAKLILGSYRADQANDPEIYVTAISHLLSRYPKDIGARLTDPKDGVAGKYKWLPSVSEVREEAEALIEAEWLIVIVAKK